ncbi:MAG: TPM domain-containing protein [Verrucomicrobia bacterium]|nr:TPM domain-containing protein [Verrucomicrobiota bacterium]
MLDTPARAAEVIPPPPQNHFNDYAGIVRPEVAAQLNRELEQFERTTSNQLLVAIYPRLQSASSVEDYTVRVAQAWRVGQKERKNGAVLFLFQESRDIRIQVGYGLEGVLPDALCKQIIENELVPRFRAGDFNAGLTAGVRALIAATSGEYRGSGRTTRDGRGKNTGGRMGGIGFIIFVLILVTLARSSARRNVVYGRQGRRSVWGGSVPWGGGGWRGGGSSGGGGGTFSGGGGSFGGGGAGGKW